MEQLIILTIIALISLVNWLMEKSAEQRRKKRETHWNQGKSYVPPVEEPEPASSKDDLRELWEALGLPQEQQYPPPPVSSYPVYEPKPEPEPEQFYQAPPIHAQPVPEVAAQTPPVSVPAPQVELSEEERAFARRFQQTEKSSQPSIPTSSLRELLGSPASLRKAMILREILGPPKALLD